MTIKQRISDWYNGTQDWPPPAPGDMVVILTPPRRYHWTARVARRIAAMTMTEWLAAVAAAATIAGVIATS